MNFNQRIQKIALKCEINGCEKGNLEFLNSF